MAAATEDAAPDAERVALPDAVLVPEMAVSAAELDAEAADAAEDAAEEADEAADEAADEGEAAAAEELELEPQLGLVFRVTPAPWHRVVAKVIVAGTHVSPFVTTAVAGTYFECQIGYR